MQVLDDQDQVSGAALELVEQGVDERCAESRAAAPGEARDRGVDVWRTRPHRVDEVSSEHGRVVVTGIQTQGHHADAGTTGGPLAQQDGLAGASGGDDQSQTARSDQVEVALELGAGTRRAEAAAGSGGR